MITVEFLITSLIVVLIPGTGVVFTVSTGLLRGRRASVFAALGCTAGIVPHLLATVLGLAALMHTSALAFQALKYAGVAYLLYLAYATWRDKSAFAVDQAASSSTGIGTLCQSDPSEHPEPEADDLLPGLLAAVHRPRRIVAARTVAVAERRVHGNDFAVFVVYGLLAHAFRCAG